LSGVVGFEDNIRSVPQSVPRLFPISCFPHRVPDAAGHFQAGRADRTKVSIRKAPNHGAKNVWYRGDLDGFPEQFHYDLAKSLVMKHLGQLVSDGFAEWRAVADNEIELRFVSGEVFLLAETTITGVM